MSSVVSSLYVGLFSSVAPFAAGMKLAENSTMSVLSKVGSLGSGLLALTGVAGLAGGAIGSMFALGKGFELAAQLENAQVQFTALTGSAQNASAILGQLRQFAASSPFALPELEDASKRLIAVGVNAANVSPLLHTIGDVAAGVGAPIGEIADIFTKVATEGTVSSREFREFAKQGIPVVQELAKQFHTTAAGVEQMADSGQIGFNQLRSAFESMTGPGGRFNGIIAAQAQTIGGVVHTMAASVEDGTANIAESLLKAFNVAGWLPKFTAGVTAITTSITDAIGRVTPDLQAFTSWTISTIGTAWDWIVEKSSGMADGVSTGFQVMFGASKWIAEIFATAFGAIGYTFTHLGDIADLACLSIADAAVTAGNQIEYIFGTVIPPMLTWLSNNWMNIFTDIGSFTMTVMANLVNNVVAVFKNLPAILNDSKNFDQLWTPLTEGFKSSLSQLPEIADRIKGPLETSLDKSLSEATAKAGEGMQASIDKSVSGVDSIFNKIGDFTKKLFGKDGPPKPDPIKFDATVNPDNLAVTVTPEIKHAKALYSGSAESIAARYAIASVTGPSNISPPVAGGGPGGPAIGSPSGPAIAGGSNAAATQKTSLDNAMLAELKKQNDQLYRIELDVRGTSGTGAQIFNF